MKEFAWRPATGVEYRVWQDPYGWVARRVVKNYASIDVSVALLGLSETEAEAKSKCESDWKKLSISPCKESNDAPAFQ